MSAIATTRSGKIEGEDLDGLVVFKGVPFAQAPTGARRWSPPEKPQPWTATREARQFRNAAPQNPVMLSTLEAMKIEQPQSEDCLYLNVWTPGLDKGKRPVMVWIHGGAFTIGAGSQSIYDGSTLARRGNAVIVTINYRLGPLGFLRLAEVTGGRIPSCGNEAMLDQVAALQWVRDNIAEFGGDPENVTIFGESAGGMSVGTLLGMPAAKGLFHKAIPQSGACHTAASVERANRVAERVLARLGVSPTETDKIRALAPAQLLKGVLLENGLPDPELGMAYQPVIDGSFLPRISIETIAKGGASDVAVMVGSNLDEWKLFAVMDPSLQQMDRAKLIARVARRLTGDFAEKLIDAYEAGRGPRGEPVTPRELFCAIETDRIFRMPAVRLAETQSSRQPRTFAYLFTWPSPAMGGMLGSCHALELGFVFGTNHLPGMVQFAGSGPAVEKLSREIQDTWLAFARTGNPSSDSVGEWRPHTEATRETMILGETTRLEAAPLEEERRAWAKIPAAAIGNL